MTLKSSKSIWVGGVVLCAVIILGGYAFLLQKKSSQMKNGSAAKQEDIAGLVTRIRAHVPVNVNETPLVAIVTDVDSAKQQSPAFYKKAENGDRLIVWSDQAILYSPSRDEVESVLTFQAGALPIPSVVSAEKATVEIRNGSGSEGNTSLLAEKLRSQGLTISTITTTKIRVYPTTLVMNTGSRVLKASSQVLAGYGTAIASSTASGEAPSASDFLIILGKNDSSTYKK